MRNTAAIQTILSKRKFLMKEVLATLEKEEGQVEEQEKQPQFVAQLQRHNYAPQIQIYFLTLREQVKPVLQN